MLNQPIQNSDVIHDTIPSYILLSFNKQINVFLHFPDFLRSFSFAPTNETRSCLNIYKATCLLEYCFKMHTYFPDKTTKWKGVGKFLG